MLVRQLKSLRTPALVLQLQSWLRGELVCTVSGCSDTIQWVNAVVFFYLESWKYGELICKVTECSDYV
jgi:hypothetical protein